MTTKISYASRVHNILENDAAIVKELVTKHDEILISLLPALIPLNVATAKLVLEQVNIHTNIKLKGRKILVERDMLQECSDIGVTKDRKEGTLLGDVQAELANITKSAVTTAENHKATYYDTILVNFTIGALTAITEFTPITHFAEIYIRLIATEEKICDYGIGYEFGKLMKIFMQIEKPIASFNLLVDEVKNDLYNVVFVAPENDKNKFRQVICTAICVASISHTIHEFFAKLNLKCLASRDKSQLQSATVTPPSIPDFASIVARSKRELLVKLRKIFPVVIKM